MGFDLQKLRREALKELPLYGKVWFVVTSAIEDFLYLLVKIFYKEEK